MASSSIPITRTRHKADDRTEEKCQLSPSRLNAAAREKEREQAAGGLPMRVQILFLRSLKRTTLFFLLFTRVTWCSPHLGVGCDNAPSTKQNHAVAKFFFLFLAEVFAPLHLNTSRWISGLWQRQWRRWEERVAGFHENCWTAMTTLRRTSLRVSRELLSAGATY